MELTGTTAQKLNQVGEVLTRIGEENENTRQKIEHIADEVTRLKGRFEDTQSHKDNKPWYVSVAALCFSIVTAVVQIRGCSLGESTSVASKKAALRGLLVELFDNYHAEHTSSVSNLPILAAIPMQLSTQPSIGTGASMPELESIPESGPDRSYDSAPQTTFDFPFQSTLEIPGLVLSKADQYLHFENARALKDQLPQGELSHTELVMLAVGAAMVGQVTLADQYFEEAEKFVAARPMDLAIVRLARAELYYGGVSPGIVDTTKANVAFAGAIVALKASNDSYAPVLQAEIHANWAVRAYSIADEATGDRQAQIAVKLFDDAAVYPDGETRKALFRSEAALASQIVRSRRVRSQYLPEGFPPSASTPEDPPAQNDSSSPLDGSSQKGLNRSADELSTTAPGLAPAVPPMEMIKEVQKTVRFQSKTDSDQAPGNTVNPSPTNPPEAAAPQDPPGQIKQRRANLDATLKAIETRLDDLYQVLKRLVEKLGQETPAEPAPQPPT